MQDSFLNKRSPHPLSLPLTKYLTAQIKAKQARINSVLAFTESDAKAYLMAVDILSLHVSTGYRFDSSNKGD